MLTRALTGFPGLSFLLAQGVPLGQKFKKKKKSSETQRVTGSDLLDINSAKMLSFRLKSKIKNLEFNT